MVKEPWRTSVVYDDAASTESVIRSQRLEHPRGGRNHDIRTFQAACYKTSILPYPLGVIFRPMYRLEPSDDVAMGNDYFRDTCAEIAIEELTQVQNVGSRLCDH